MVLLKLRMRLKQGGGKDIDGEDEWQGDSSDDEIETGILTFLESVCGRVSWGKAKFNGMISSATLNNATTERIVTVSDDAFALLLLRTELKVG